MNVVTSSVLVGKLPEDRAGREADTNFEHVDAAAEKDGLSVIVAQRY